MKTNITPWTKKAETELTTPHRYFKAAVQWEKKLVR